MVSPSSGDERHRRPLRRGPASLSNAVGDPNPVLPGAYYADGDSSIAGGRPPGTLLPDIARPNPFVGLPYVQGQVTQQQFDQRSESLRASVGYGD